MTQALWAIRFYLPFEEDKSIEFIGNFEKAGKRFLDDVVVFSGIYGMPDYLMWYIHKDLISYNFSSYSLELKLFLDGDRNNCYFTDKYRIVDVGDDLASDRKLLYAIQEDYAKLEILLIDAGVATLEYNEKRNVEDLLKEILEKNGIFPVIFCEHKDPLLQSIKFEYQKFTVDPSWSIRDFIQYVANENNFEWTIKFGILFIGPELPTYSEMKASKDVLNNQVDNISKNYWNMKITWAATPLNVFYHYEVTEDEKITDMRCVWVKHWVGNNGDTTKGLFIPTGTQIDKNQYVQSLEGDKEKDNISYVFNNPKYHDSIVGRITKDEGDNKFADEVTIQKDEDKWPIKTPENMVMNISKPVYSLPKLGRTTPYLDYNAGLLFPRSLDLTKNPNQLIFSPYGRIEQSILGPFIMGNGDSEFKIPKKDPDDLRFQLTDGFCIYKKKDGKFYLQLLDTDAESIPEEDDTKVYLYMGEDGKIKINQSQSCSVEIDKNGKITITSSSDTIINSSGKVDVNGSGEVTIDGITTKIQGGGNKISHGDHDHGMDHIHTTGNLGIPVPGFPTMTRIPGITIKTDTHLPIQGSIKTEVD